MSEPAFRFSPRPNRAHEIHWHDWGAEAFDQAIREDKPILLAISAVWCHWCHVMDETSYSDPTIIARLNEEFIPIRVDNDQRPDINQRYNMGGWPTTAILSPAGEIITGGTYIAADQMTSLLDQVAQYWVENRDQIRNQLNEPSQPTLVQHQGAYDEVINQVMETIRQQFDRAYGGLGQAPKFPQPEVWDLALTRFTSTGDGWAAGMAVRTLDAMAGSNLYDQVAGGFFRYSTTREWTIPHFEKMLEENAAMARLYLKAYQILGDESYREIAERVLQWANGTLLDSDGLWGGSQDADEEYYQLPAENRVQRKAPFVDPVIHTSSNAAMISAQLLAASLINPGAYAPIALTALESLWDRMWEADQGLFHADSGERHAPGLLSDVAHMGWALLDGYEYTGDEIFLERLQELLTHADRTLWAGRVYWDQPLREGAVGRLKHRQHPLAENALMARLYLRLGTLTDDETLLTRGRDIVSALSQFATEQGLFGAGWAIAADAADAPPLTATLVDSQSHSGADLRHAMYGVFDRRRAIRSWPVGSPEFVQSGYPEIPLPALYICRGTTCAAPVTTPEGILEALRSLFEQDPGAIESPDPE